MARPRFDTSPYHQTTAYGGRQLNVASLAALIIATSERYEGVSAHCA
jgi:hypothetical protein